MDVIPYNITRDTVWRKEERKLQNYHMYNNKRQTASTWQYKQLTNVFGKKNRTEANKTHFLRGD